MGKELCQSTEHQILTTIHCFHNLSQTPWWWIPDPLKKKKKKPLVKKIYIFFSTVGSKHTEQPHAFLDLQWAYL